jgi:hypothetical protein
MVMTSRFEHRTKLGYAYAQVREVRLCPRLDTHLTYMIDIALTAEFGIHTGGERYWALE